MTGKPKIVLVTGWLSETHRSAVPIVLRLVKILQPLSSQLSCVVSNLSVEGSLNSSTTLVRIRSRHVRGALLRAILYYLLYQVRVTLAMLKLIVLSKADLFIFAEGSDSLLFPILFGRLAGKKVIIRSDGRPSYSLRRYCQEYSRIGIAIRSALYHMIETIIYSLASKIAPACKCMIESYSLQRYSNKVGIASLYVDTRVFRSTKEMTERAYDIGYVGRLSREKGALQFVQSLPLLATNRQIQAIVVGDGELKDEIERILARNNFQGKADLPGWVENKEIPYYLNDMKMVVIPSYYEGLPNLMLESMACGTVVLATAVGGIPDVIVDGETGFIMEDNSPECIARNAVRALNHRDLEQITINARALIEKEYTYEAAVERYRDILTT